MKQPSESSGPTIERGQTWIPTKRGSGWRHICEADRNSVIARSIPEDKPKFKRIYTAEIGRGFTLTVSSENGMFGPRISGELTQPGGRWVYFDPERIADKILDRELLPVVERFVSVILAIDKAFRRNAPNQFRDESGTAWQRA